MVHISVYRLSGSLCLKTMVGPEAAVSTVKEELYNILCIPPIFQELLLDSTVLDDNAICNDFCQGREDQQIVLGMTITMDKWHQGDTAAKITALQDIVAQEPEEQSDRSRVLVAAALDDHSETVQNEAAQILARIGRGDEVVIESVVQRLQHDDANVRQRAVDCLHELLPNCRTDNIHTDVIAALVHCLSNSSQGVQERAAIALGSLAKRGDRRVLNAMSDVLESRRDAAYVLRAVLEALTKIVFHRNEKLIILAAAKLDHIDPYVRRWAVELLAKVSDVGERLAITAVIAHFEHPNDDIRISADTALRHVAQVGDQFTMDLLACLFSHEDLGVRLAAKVAYRYFAR